MSTSGRTSICTAAARSLRFTRFRTTALPNHLACDEPEAGDAAGARYDTEDEQLVSVDTTLAVRGGKVFAPA